MSGAASTASTPRGPREPSLEGVPWPSRPWRGGETMHRLGLEEVLYDCFGELEGFVLGDCCSEHEAFECRQPRLGLLLLRACRDHLRVAVVVDGNHNRCICGIRPSR